MGAKGIKIKVKALAKDIQKVTLNGVLDGHTSYSFSQSLIGLLRGATRKVIVDCADLTYISSAGIGVLVRTQLRLQAAGQSLTLTNVQPRVRAVLHFAALEPFFGLE